MRRRILAGIAGVALLPALACLGPTEVTVSIRTNAPCTDPARWKGVALYVGAPGIDVESKDPTLVTAECDPDGNIGTIVVKPSGAKDAAVGVRVVAGLDKAPEECRTASYAGCIVSRRTVNYSPHENVNLIIDLTLDCTGLGCDLNHTCVSGVCTDTVIAATPVSDDGGVLGTGSEAGGGTGAKVRCGNTYCPANDPEHTCCLTQDPKTLAVSGSCMPSTQCISPAAALLCDKPSDCPGFSADAGTYDLTGCNMGQEGPMTCCADVNNAPNGYQSMLHVYRTMCLPLCECPASAGLGTVSPTQMCDDNLPCVGPKPCKPWTNVLPTYSFCGSDLVNQ